VLAASGTNLVTLSPGVFATTAMPILGTNPPPPSKRPPLNAAVHCQTQQPPDLRSDPGPPPPQRQLDTSSPAYKTAMAKARADAIAWLQGTIKREGLSNSLRVSNQDVTPALIQQLAGQVKAQDAATRAKLKGSSK
jgi:hypothetical protein